MILDYEVELHLGLTQRQALEAGMLHALIHEADLVAFASVLALDPSQVVE